ncbi:MAG: hypothetical protein AAF687_11380 [Pseudomonadota bacterium]
MLRFSILATVIALGACSGPSFDDQLAGTWDCKPEAPNPDTTMDYTLTYNRDGEITGEMVFEQENEEAKSTLRGTLAGTWSYDGKKLDHKMTETFKDLTVNGELVPREEVNPEIIANFRSEDSYDDPVDLKDGKLIWYNDPERTQIGVECTKRS